MRFVKSCSVESGCRVSQTYSVSCELVARRLRLGGSQLVVRSAKTATSLSRIHRVGGSLSDAARLSFKAFDSSLEVAPRDHRHVGASLLEPVFKFIESLSSKLLSASHPAPHTYCDQCN